jgi:hypothetical protein
MHIRPVSQTSPQRRSNCKGFIVEEIRTILQRKNKKILFFVVALGILSCILVTVVRFQITGNFEGVFLLAGKQGRLFELKDDLFLGEGNRYIAGIDLEREKQFFYHLFHASAAQPPYLYLEWNEKSGQGFIRNFLPGGHQILTCFGRFLEDGKKEVSGLFVGGGLPATVAGEDPKMENETGMAYFNGQRWFHIWCNVNEGIVTERLHNLYPSTWKFLGSKVLHYNDQDAILESSHEAQADGVPLRIVRHVHVRAGETYFVLTITIRNVGNTAAKYSYFYGDEPWLGNFGSSAGNVGWSAEAIYDYATVVNTNRTNFAGFFDYGNDAIGEGHDFTLASNFIEWFGNRKPYVYFSNGPDQPPQLGQPLSSKTRFLAILWGPRTLQPGQSETYTLAIGMAGLGRFPVKPEVHLDGFP